MPSFEIFYDDDSIIIDAVNIAAALSEFEDLVIYSEIKDVIELPEETTG